MLHNFDTHQIVKNFIKSGFKEAQAEAIVKTISDSRDNDLSHLATKMDIIGLKTEIAEVDNSLSFKIVEVDNSLSFKIVEVDNSLSLKIAEVDNNLSSKIVEVDNSLSLKIAEVDNNLSSKIAEVDNSLSLKIAEVESRLSLEIANVRSEIEKSKNEMLKWFIGINVTIGVAYISTMIACFKFFIN